MQRNSKLYRCSIHKEEEYNSLIFRYELPTAFLPESTVWKRRFKEDNFTVEKSDNICQPGDQGQHQQ